VKPASGAHPENLLWYAGGSLEPEERSSVELHLAVCRRCREDLALFRSMTRSVREQTRIDHASPAELMKMLEPGPGTAGSRAAFLDEHLAACLECSSDLARLREARRVEERLFAGGSGEAAAAPGRRRWARMAAYAAALLVLAGLGGWSLGRVFPPAEIARPAAAGASASLPTLLPPERGAAREARLSPSGPWKLRVVLPFGHEEGAYSASLQGAGLAAPVSIGEEIVPTREGVAILALPGPLAPGRFRVTLTPRAGANPRSYGYDFEVAEEP